MRYCQDLTLQGYGVTLRRLTHDKIEMVRQWRNDPKISQYMFFRDYISSEMQEAWFKKINNDNNFYFIIEYNEREIGCCDLKDIDYVSQTCEPGIFIYDENYLSTDIPVRAYLSMVDFGFDTLGLKEFWGHILRENIRAIKFNKSLGYVLAPNQEINDLQLWILQKDNFDKHTQKIKKFLKNSI